MPVLRGLVDHLRAVYLRFLKVTALAASLSLTAAELAYLARSAGLGVGAQPWLNSLPVTGGPDPATATGLRDVLTALLDFARIKAALSPTDERLLAVLQEPGPPSPGTTVLLALTGWDQHSLDTLLTRFYGNTQPASLGHIEAFRRVYDAYAIVTTCGISADKLIEATTNDPTRRAWPPISRRPCGPATPKPDWLAVVKPINDTMRDLQRDALVAYILQQARPVLPPRRHRPTAHQHAGRAVRVLPDRHRDGAVHADVPDPPCPILGPAVRRTVPAQPRTGCQPPRHRPSRRVGLAQALPGLAGQPRGLPVARELARPELRDDQSPFFKDTMSSCCKATSPTTPPPRPTSTTSTTWRRSPSSNHVACTTARRRDTGEVAHVIARTAGANRKYYYRRMEAAGWTPWEHIKLDIEDDPVIPFVWNGRLLLFWLRLLKQTPVDETVPQPANSTDNLAGVKLKDIYPTANRVRPFVTISAILCYSEYYNGKWQTTKTSDVNRPTTVGSEYLSDFDRSRLYLGAGSIDGLPADTLMVRVDSQPPNPNFAEAGPPGYVLYNTHSVPVRAEDFGSFPPAVWPPTWRQIPEWTNEPYTFWIIYGTSADSLHISLLDAPVGERVVDTQPGLDDVWEAPLFFEDSRYVFYVTTTRHAVSQASFDGFGILGPGAPASGRLFLPRAGGIPSAIGTMGLSDTTGPPSRPPGSQPNGFPEPA